MIDEGYKKLDIYVLAHELAVMVHQSSLSLPKHEMYEHLEILFETRSLSDQNLFDQLRNQYEVRSHKLSHAITKSHTLFENQTSPT